MSYSQSSDHIIMLADYTLYSVELEISKDGIRDESLVRISRGRRDIETWQFKLRNPI